MVSRNLLLMLVIEPDILMVSLVLNLSSGDTMQHPPEILWHRISREQLWLPMVTHCSFSILMVSLWTRDSFYFYSYYLLHSNNSLCKYRTLISPSSFIHLLFIHSFVHSFRMCIYFSTASSVYFSHFSVTASVGLF
jgi:hypothetical protein